MTKRRSNMMAPGAPEIILASASASRASLLEAAGVDVQIQPAGVDETAIREVLERDSGTAPADVAEVLARAKAEEVSADAPAALVIGADQVLALDGKVYEKPDSMESARRTLLDLAGETHQLHACVAVATAGNTVWTHSATAHLSARAYQPAFVGQYLAQVGEAALTSVGAYQLEGPGVHLFEKIDGDYFTILGLPLLPLLDYLRQEGVIVS